MASEDHVWKKPEVVRQYLSDVVTAIPCRAEQIEVMLRVVEGRGGEVESFLDLGCGDGILTDALLRQYPEARGTLVDFSEPMLAAARERFAGASTDLQFITADFGDPDWTEALKGRAPFDVIFSAFSIHHQPDAEKKRVYAEIFELLKPGGMFVNDEHVASATPWVEARWDRLMINAMVAHQAKAGGGKSAEQIEEEYVNREDKAANILAPVWDQCEWLREIGFVDVDCYFKIFELAVFGGRRPE